MKRGSNQDTQGFQSGYGGSNLGHFQDPPLLQCRMFWGILPVLECLGSYLGIEALLRGEPISPTEVSGGTLPRLSPSRSLIPIGGRGPL